MPLNIDGKVFWQGFKCASDRVRHVTKQYAQKNCTDRHWVYLDTSVIGTHPFRTVHPLTFFSTSPLSLSLCLSPSLSLTHTQHTQHTHTHTHTWHKYTCIYSIYWWLGTTFSPQHCADSLIWLQSWWPHRILGLKKKRMNWDVRNKANKTWNGIVTDQDGGIGAQRLRIFGKGDFGSEGSDKKRRVNIGKRLTVLLTTERTKNLFHITSVFAVNQY